MVLMRYNALPYPVEVFGLDGMALYINRAMIELHGISDPDLIVGKYNLRKDPLYKSDKTQREAIERAFSGEEVVVRNFSPPVQVLVDRSSVKETPCKPAMTDVRLSPVFVNGEVRLVVATFLQMKREK